MALKNKLKWKPALPVRKSDKILSSDNRMSGDLFGFVPTFEYEKDTNFYYLLHNEYYRLWFNERKKYEKITYAQKRTLQEEFNIRRRYVLRELKHKERLKPLPIIKIARFQNIPSKIDNRRIHENPNEDITEKKNDKPDKNDKSDKKKCIIKVTYNAEN